MPNKEDNKVYLDRPDCDCEESPDQEKESTMTPDDYSMLKMHCLNGAQAAADSSRLFAETLRLDHLEQRRVMDQQESVAARNYHASGDGPGPNPAR